MKTSIAVLIFSLVIVGCGQEANCDNNQAIAARAVTTTAPAATPTPAPKVTKQASSGVATGDGCGAPIKQGDCTVDQFNESCNQ